MAGLYIHIPFCATRCLYCDFFSSARQQHKAAFLKAILKEMEQRKDYLAGETLDTVYMGGGTPSMLSAAEWEPIFEAVCRLFPLAGNAEITLEANPDDLTPDYVASLRRLPFNRLSIGIQSFHDEDLRFLRRRHTARQAIDAVRLCRDNGYDNISIDLIYGLPGQTPALWEQNLDEALRLDPVHLSAYHLTYEEGTPLHRLKEAGLLQPADEEVSLALFNLLRKRMTEAGYQHYEISNFARPRCHSRHNSAYWTGEKYLGVGPSAHSYDRESRQWNIASLPLYIQGIENDAPCSEKETLNIHNKYNEYLLTGLRTSRGISLSYMLTKFGEEKYNYCIMQAERYVNTGILRVEADKMLFSPDGLRLSDAVISDLLWV
ncbi:MAG: radical SAM family heme chaperone HemW [Tannerellaceae bacterium]|jgi:oxygen-independent coproporphyrinogen-3 oxidase|nr:radical SAM family heme chaperone HemW [Tannerellaceae bacterium]